MTKKNIVKTLSKKDIEEGRKLNSIFENLSEEGKIMAITYLSALRDKEILTRKIAESVG